MSSGYWLGVDLGGTHIRLAIVDDTGAILHEHRGASPSASSVSVDRGYVGARQCGCCHASAPRLINTSHRCRSAPGKSVNAIHR